MKILLLSSAYNSLTQLAHVWLKASHYEVAVATATTAETMRQAVTQFQPDLILCPMLAQVIPHDIWENHTCIIIHPGIAGDRGPNSLDWAILNENRSRSKMGSTVDLFLSEEVARKSSYNFSVGLALVSMRSLLVWQ